MIFRVFASLSQTASRIAEMIWLRSSAFIRGELIGFKRNSLTQDHVKR